MPHRGLRLWLREDPASPRPTGERARAACRDNSNEDPASPRPTGERARAACRDNSKRHSNGDLILDRHLSKSLFLDFMLFRNMAALCAPLFFIGSSEKSQVQIEAKKTDIRSYEYIKYIF